MQANTTVASTPRRLEKQYRGTLRDCSLMGVEMMLILADDSDSTREFVDEHFENYEARQERTERTFSVGKVGEDCGKKKGTHAQVLLLADSGKHGSAWKDAAISEGCQGTVQTVENIRERLVLDGLESALCCKKQFRPSRQSILDGDKEARVLATCCGSPPSGRACWTLRLLTERVVELKIVETVSHETVRRCLKHTN